MGGLHGSDRTPTVQFESLSDPKKKECGPTMLGVADLNPKMV